MKKSVPSSRSTRLGHSRARKARLARAADRRAARAPPSGFGLASECTLADAEGLKLRLAKLLNSVTPVTLDVQAVQRIDTASMQLLAAFVRDRKAIGLQVGLTGESAVFTEATRLLGFGALLDPAGSTAAQPVS